MKIVSWNILANEFIKKVDYPMIKTKILFNRKGRLTQITNILKNANDYTTVSFVLCSHMYVFTLFYVQVFAKL